MIQALRRMGRWLSGADGPDEYAHGFQYGVGHDLTGEEPRVPDHLLTRQAEAAAGEAALGTALHEELGGVERTVSERQEDYTGDVATLRAAAAQAQLAVRIRDDAQKAQAAREAADLRAGRTSTLRRALWPPWVHVMYAVVALPGEVCFTGIALMQTDRFAFLAWATALTICIVFFGASIVAGHMWARLLRVRTTHPDPFARVALVGSVLVGLMFALTLPFLRVRIEGASFRAEQAAFADQGLDSSGLHAPNSLATFGLYFAIYVGFFAVSALVAAMTWQPVAREEVAADAALDDHRDAVEEFLESESALREAVAAGPRAVELAIERSDHLWLGFEASVSRWVEGLGDGHADPLPEGWAQLARGGARPALPLWRQNPPAVPTARYLSDEERERLFNIIEPADLPPLRPGDRFAPAGAGAATGTNAGQGGRGPAGGSDGGPGGAGAGDGIGQTDGGDAGAQHAGTSTDDPGAGGPTPPGGGQAGANGTGPGTAGTNGAGPGSAGTNGTGPAAKGFGSPNGSATNGRAGDGSGEGVGDADPSERPEHGDDEPRPADGAVDDETPTNAPETETDHQEVFATDDNPLGL